MAARKLSEQERETLTKLGWTPELIEIVTRERTPAMKAVDQGFLDAAKNTLRQANLSAMEYLNDHPGASLVTLAKNLGRGVCAMGLRMAVYEEAQQMGHLRSMAMDVLTRQILKKFPMGWSSTGNISPSVMIGSWDTDLEDFSNDERIDGYARAIIDDLSINHPPPEGWKPQVKNDPFLVKLFDRHWPE